MNILIFTGGLSPKPSELSNFFDSINSIDYIIACDSGLDTLEIYHQYYLNKINFIPSLIIGDMDSVKTKNISQRYSQAKIERYPHYKDFTDTELGLIKATEIKNNNKDCKIILIGGDGGRIDHLFGILGCFSESYKPDYWICTENIICCIESNQKCLIKNLTAEDRVSVVNPTPTKECVLRTYGLEWPDNLFKNGFIMSLSNCISEEYLKRQKNVEIDVNKGCCLVISPLSVVIKKIDVII